MGDGGTTEREEGTRDGEDAPARREPRHGPPRRPPSPRPRPAGARGGLARVIGLLATLVLLGVGIAVVLTLTGHGGKSEQQTFTPARKATSTPAARQHRVAKPRLTNAQRASRNAAVAQMRRQGFEPVAVGVYKPRQTLRVLIGRPKASNGVRGRRAFFFVRENYIGTDAAEPSARLRVVHQSGSQITLAYTRFAPGDKPCCPSDGTVKVRFAMGGGRLQPLDPIPPAASRMPPPS